MAEEKAPRRLEYMPLTQVQGATRNPKAHRDTEIGTSIGRFGYVEPIVLDERTGRLVAGHGRLTSLRVRAHAGETPPEGIKVVDGEWHVPVLRGWASRSDTEAEAYLLASNQLTIAGGWDESALGDMLKDLSDSQALDGVGFDDAELKRLLAQAAKQDPAGVDFPAYDEDAADDVKMLTCPHCSQQFPA